MRAAQHRQACLVGAGPACRALVAQSLPGVVAASCPCLGALEEHPWGLVVGPCLEGRLPSFQGLGGHHRVQHHPALGDHRYLDLGALLEGPSCRLVPWGAARQVALMA